MGENKILSFSLPNSSNTTFFKIRVFNYRYLCICLKYVMFKHIICKWNELQNIKDKRVLGLLYFKAIQLLRKLGSKTLRLITCICIWKFLLKKLKQYNC